jgi:prefoldin subunit 5
VRSVRRAAPIWFGTLAILASPAVRAAASECTTVTLNGSCVIRIDREAPVTPLPVRLTARSSVTLEVTKRPLEQILFDVALADTVPADPLGAIFGQLIGPLKSLVKSVSLTAAPPPVGPAPPAFSPATEVARLLMDIEQQQQKVQAEIKPIDAEIKRVGKDLKAFQKRKAGTWTVTEFARFRDTFLCDVGRGGPYACRAGSTPLAMAPLPNGVLDALDEKIKKTREKYAALDFSDRDALADDMNAVTSNQAGLRAAVKSLGEAQSALVAAADVLESLNATTVQDVLVLGGFGSHVSRSATIKVTAQDLVTKATTALATVVVQYGGTRWEVSGGALFSATPTRTFAVAPIIENGAPRLDPAGKILTRIVETRTRPMVVPFVFAHYRLLEGTLGSQRVAFLATGGLGVNTSSGSADAAIGATFSYRGLMVTPSLHFVRELRLTSGLQPGQELGSAPPSSLPTERHWVRKFALGLTYRLPIN